MSYYIRSSPAESCEGDQAQSSEFSGSLDGKRGGIIGKPEVNLYALGKEKPVTGVFIRQEKESLRFCGWRQAKG